ncbi:uncharacterized protein LOC124122943 [Haliotis rufescens]|uniref:uncharacterized protein LOC124122943 n=1 Tax=Haliotis rufescens TaxID=6454 RepID=UPI001EAFD8BC|nr:uncharacterized protein LOC124122943 [Haliotis rufescens]
MSAAYSIIDKEDGVVIEKHRLSCEQTTACLIVTLSICVNLTLGVTILLSINLGYGTELASRTSPSRQMIDRYSVCTECHYFGHAEKHTRHGRLVKRVETNDGQICCLHQAESLWRLLNLIHMESLMQQPTSPGQVSFPPPSAHLYLDTLQESDYKWSEEFGYGAAHVTGGIKMASGRLQISHPGYYNIYSFITLKTRSELTRNLRVKHSVRRISKHPEPHTDIVLQRSASMSRISETFINSYLDGVIKLNAKDEIYVDVSNVSSIYKYAPSNVFGLHLVRYI